MKKSRKSSQSGNMLIYILGAIFLLGILIVVSKGNYQPGTGIDQEAVLIKVQEVRRYASELERGVQYAMRNGISESDLRFAHPNALSAYGTYGTNPKAEIFNPAGGAVEWKNPPTGIQTTAAQWVFIGNNEALQIGSTCALARCSDLMAILPNVTQSFCIATNNSVGITNPSGVPPKEGSSFNIGVPFAGTYTYNNELNVIGNHTHGKSEGCFEGSTGTGIVNGNFYYYKVLLGR